MLELVLALGMDLGGAHPAFVSDRLEDLELVNVAALASSFASAALVAAGIARLRGGRRAAAYASLERAVLLAIFVTQVFAFVESQFGAVFGLAVNLVLLWSLRAVRATLPAGPASRRAISGAVDIGGVRPVPHGEASTS